MEATEEMIKIERHITRTASVVLYSSSKDQNELAAWLLESSRTIEVEADLRFNNKPPFLSTFTLNAGFELARFSGRGYKSIVERSMSMMDKLPLVFCEDKIKCWDFPYI